MGLVLTGLMLTFATINDLINRKIKNIIPLTFAVIGMVLGSPQSFIQALLFSAVLFIFLFALPNIFGINEFMGAGDVKLYMATAFIMGWNFTLYTFVYSIFIGAICLSLLNINRLKEITVNVYYFVTSKGRWHIDETESKTNIFAPYILLGAIAHHIININWII